ncbi:MAG TPA: helix-turn-helix domain-containing protein [Ktedonobacterales bacterium]
MPLFGDLGKQLSDAGKQFGLSDVFKNLPQFGAVLRQYRTLHGVTIEELAAAVEISPSALREMEEGRRPAPSEKKVKAICKALKLDAEEEESLTDIAELDSPVAAAITGRAQVAVAQPLSAAIFVFLIADIRGYTAFTTRHGDRAAAILATRFAEQAHAVIDRWGGRLVEVRGDEALGVFASAQQALRAAHDLHARYTALTRDNPEWPDGIGIGLDVGEAEPVEGGYRGIAVNRAARLCSLAAPGETLVTTGVAYVAPVVDNVTYSLHGHEQLKGFDGAVPILLAAPGGPEPTPSVEAGDREQPEQRQLPEASEASGD